MNDFIPRSDTKLIVWLANLSSRLGTYGKSLGLTPSEISASQRSCSEIVEAIKNADQKHKDWLGAVQQTHRTKRSGIPALRSTIARLKVSPAWTPSIGKEMGAIRPTPQPAAMDTYRPRLKVETVGGRIQIRFTRRPVDGINIYTRKKGEGTWRFLGRATQSPYVDPTPLALANTAEIREYQAYGVRKDQEVGQQSDVVVIPLRD